MYLYCETCGADGDAGLPFQDGHAGLLTCPVCDAVACHVEVARHVDFLADQVARKSTLATRKQHPGASDAEISLDGLAAELAAACVICPASVDRYLRAAEVDGQNRGRDLPPSLTGLDLPVEVKSTQYRTATTGCLIVRPPRMTPGVMRTEYLDDSIYVLAHGKPYAYSVLGWCDRDHLVRHGRMNPVPVRPGQRQTWGLHWSKLRPLHELAGHFVRPQSPGLARVG